MERGEIVWQPGEDARARTRLGRYLDWIGATRGLELTSYEEAWRWSVADLEGFWSSVIEHLGLELSGSREPVVAERALPGARWLPGARCNYALSVLRRCPSDTSVAVVGESQSRTQLTWSGAELLDQVGRVRAGLVRLGVGRGTRVAAILPNIPETIAAFLASASLGAIWSSCAPEFGPKAVVDRFSQIEPSVLLAVDGYRYGAKDVDRRAELEEIAASLPSVGARVLLPYRDPAAPVPPGWQAWSELVSQPAPMAYEQVPFDHPLYILYSSGTTGLPKAIVHGHGGILLEHAKVLAFHHDLGPGDRFFWYSTTGWMMWNLLVSGLLVGAAVVCFDGDPAWPDLGALWGLAARAGITYFGTSAPYLHRLAKEGVDPRSFGDLGALRAVGSTGAPLSADGFRYVTGVFGPEVHLASMSGGTDVCSAFVGGSPLVAVRAGEISCRCLGVDAVAVDPLGREVVDVEGELVVRAPMPSMPVGFWGDPDGSRYRAAYFEDFPGSWRHGDWVTFFGDGACVISGRSDATLNRGGVRLGTAELYAVVESLPEVRDSLVVHLEGGGDGSGMLVLFVVLAPGSDLTPALEDQLRTSLRRELSPRHVPDRIVAVAGVPRTLSGKKLEVPVKRILQGEDPERVVSRESLADPGALDAFVELAGRLGERP